MIRTLPAFSMAPSADDMGPTSLPPLGHDISRPSSTSTIGSSTALRQHYQQGQHNLNVALPGLSALASAASAPSPQLRAYGTNGVNHYATASPTPTSVSGQGNTPPVCQNCTTSTTPLWRRDEIGSVLCNACGLFLKLHGRPRPISLKTDVIKSRNRVKSSGQGPKKKSHFDGNGVASRSDAGTPPPKHPSHRRVSHKSSGDSDRSQSPISRTTTPALHHPANIAPQHMFDASLTDPVFHHSPSLPALHLRHPSPGSTTSLNDRHLEPPLTYEAMQQTNNSFKTRINELEVINNLFRDRVHELEENARNAEIMQNQFRDALHQSQQRQNSLKRRVDELEQENTQLREGNGLPHKRSRLSAEGSQYPESSEMQKTST